MNGRTQQPPLTNMNLLQNYKLKGVLATSIPSLVYIPQNTGFTPPCAQWAETYRRWNIDKLTVVSPPQKMYICWLIIID
jgi:hypothetical protein